MFSLLDLSIFSYFSKLIILNFEQNLKGRSIEIVYALNYNTKINEIITDSKYMEQLGYVLPEKCRNLALQVKNQFF
jgi:hypothetical protein